MPFRPLLFKQVSQRFAGRLPFIKNKIPGLAKRTWKSRPKVTSLRSHMKRRPRCGFNKNFQFCFTQKQTDPSFHLPIGMFPKIVVNPPKWLVKIMVPDPMNKWMIWWVKTPYFWKHPWFFHGLRDFLAAAFWGRERNSQLEPKSKGKSAGGVVCFEKQQGDVPFGTVVYINMGVYVYIYIYKLYIIYIYYIYYIYIYYIYILLYIMYIICILYIYIHQTYNIMHQL